MNVKVGRNRKRNRVDLSRAFKQAGIFCCYFNPIIHSAKSARDLNESHWRMFYCHKVPTEFSFISCFVKKLMDNGSFKNVCFTIKIESEQQNVVGSFQKLSTKQSHFIVILSHAIKMRTIGRRTKKLMSYLVIMLTSLKIKESITLANFCQTFVNTS